MEGKGRPLFDLTIALLHVQATARSVDLPDHLDLWTGSRHARDSTRSFYVLI